MSDARHTTDVLDIDPSLVLEAFRRAQHSRREACEDPHLILDAIVAEARRGTRDLHGLTGAAMRMPRAA